MRTKKENQLKRLVIADGDLFLAQRLASYLLINDLLPARNYDEQLIRLAFQTALIVTYGRQFIESRGGSDAIPGTLFGRHIRVLNENEKRLHHRILNLRNSIYAHSDGDEYDMKFSRVDMTELGVDLVLPESKNPHAPLERSEVEVFVAVVEKVLDSVRRHRIELEAELFPDAGD